MARKYRIRTVALPLELYDALVRLKEQERKYSSFASYVADILDHYLKSKAESGVITNVRPPEKGEHGERRKTA